MAQSIKLGSDTYLDWSGVTINSSGKTLDKILAGFGGSGTISLTTSKNFLISVGTDAAFYGIIIAMNRRAGGYSPLFAVFQKYQTSVTVVTLTAQSGLTGANNATGIQITMPDTYYSVMVIANEAVTLTAV